MTDQSDATQADASAQSQADTDQIDQQADDTRAESSQESISLDEAKKLRSEAANLRKRLKDAEGKVKQIEDAEKSDLEKLTGERDDFKGRYESLEAKYRASVAESAVRDAATTAGAISARAVYALIRDDVTFDDDGHPENVSALIQKAQADEPSLFRKAAGSGDGGKRGAPVEGKNDINAALRQMADSAR